MKKQEPELLLLSSSFADGVGYLEHCSAVVQEFLEACPPGHVILVPYAKYDMDKLADMAIEFFHGIGQSCISLHRTHKPLEALQKHDVKAIFVAGGNTFRLLKVLQDNGLLEAMKDKVNRGAGYMGVSAGTNLACPTIMTTNDMPIVTPRDFNALELVNFQINAHYVPGRLIPGHRGESREQRITEYHQENSLPVVGLPETSWIRGKDGKIMLGGKKDATIFRPGKPEKTWKVGSSFEPLSDVQ